MNPLKFIQAQSLWVKIIIVTIVILIAGNLFSQSALAYDSTAIEQESLTGDTLLPDSGVVITPPTTVDGIEIPSTDPLVSIDVDGLILWEQFLYHVMLLLFAWLSYLFPILKKKNIKYRTAAIGVTLIAVFVGMRYFTDGAFSVGVILSYIVNFLVTTRAYDKIYSELFGKSPRPNPEAL